MIDVTFGVLNYNPGLDAAATAAYIAAVESLAANRSKSLTSEVYLIDQASQPELTEQLARRYGFHAITLRRNVGISRGINLLANMARGQYVSLVTSDVTFTSGLDDTLIAALRADPKIYQICPVSDNASLAHQRLLQAHPDGMLIENVSQELTIQFWPRSVFDEIGYFDEQWKACYENLDFTLRAFLNGGHVIVHQGAFCHHEHNMTSKSGAFESAYDNYMEMPKGPHSITARHAILKNMWDAKWPDLDRYLNIYDTFTQNMGQTRAAMFHAYSKNVYLPYVQEVAY